MDDLNNNTAGNNPFAPPKAQVEDAVAVTGELAGRGARLVAAIIDGLTFAAIAFVAGMLTSVSFFDPDTPFSAGYAMAYVLALVVFFAIQGWLLHERSQTLGKIALGIRIVRTDGSRATVGRLIGLRMVPMWLISLVPLIGPFISLIDSLLIFRESRHCLHDDIADTIVVRV